MQQCKLGDGKIPYVVEDAARKERYKKGNRKPSIQTSYKPITLKASAASNSADGLGQTSETETEDINVSLFKVNDSRLSVSSVVHEESETFFGYGIDIRATNDQGFVIKYRVIDEEYTNVMTVKKQEVTNKVYTVYKSNASTNAFSISADIAFEPTSNIALSAGLSSSKRFESKSQAISLLLDQKYITQSKYIDIPVQVNNVFLDEYFIEAIQEETWENASRIIANYGTHLLERADFGIRFTYKADSVVDSNDKMEEIETNFKLKAGYYGSVALHGDYTNNNLKKNILTKTVESWNGDPSLIQKMRALLGYANRKEIDNLISDEKIIKQSLETENANQPLDWSSLEVRNIESESKLVGISSRCRKISDLIANHQLKSMVEIMIENKLAKALNPAFYSKLGSKIDLHLTDQLVSVHQISIKFVTSYKQCFNLWFKPGAGVENTIQLPFFKGTIEKLTLEYDGRRAIEHIHIIVIEPEYLSYSLPNEKVQGPLIGRDIVIESNSYKPIPIPRPTGY